MKKNELIQSFKIIILGLVLSFGVSLVFAQWTPPTGGAQPGNNTPGPLNVGSDSQQKAGDLKVGLTPNNEPTNLLTASGFSTSAILATSNSSFLEKLFVGGIPPNQSTATRLFVIGDITSTNLSANGANNTVCATNTGKLILCSAAACGSANGELFTSVPTTNLCSSGATPSAVNGNGPWNWTCTTGGSTSNCSADMKIIPSILTQELNSPECYSQNTNFHGSVEGGYGNVTYTWAISSIPSTPTCQSFTENHVGQDTGSLPLPRHKGPGTGICNYSATLTVEDSANPQHTATGSQVIQVSPSTDPTCTL